jgi:hypothetical protein
MEKKRQPECLTVRRSQVKMKYHASVLNGGYKILTAASKTLH